MAPKFERINYNSVNLDNTDEIAYEYFTHMRRAQYRLAVYRSTNSKAVNKDMLIVIDYWRTLYREAEIHSQKEAGYIV